MSGVEWQKVLFGLVAGWFLAQFTSYILWRLRARRTKKLLEEELVDLHKQVHRIFVGLQRAFQAYGANVVEPNSTVPVSNPIFQAHYKDAVLHLASSKRLLYQLIHGHVAKLNEFVLKKDQANDAVRAEFNEFGKSERLAKLVRDYEWLLRACYGQCWMLDWHIKQQLESDDPDLEIGTAKHKAYLDMLKEVSAKANVLIEQGRAMSPSQFEVPYHPDSFASS